MARRLRPLTDTRPKCLLTVAGKTLLHRTVDAMAATGITDFLVITGYREEMLREALKDYRSDRLRFRFIDNADYEHNNNIYSLYLALNAISDGDLLLMDSDILADPAAVARVAAASLPALAMNRHELGEEEMKIVVDGDGQIVEISKTCSPADAIGESVGIERITADYGAALRSELQQMIEQEGLVDVFYEQAFQRLIPKGHTFRVIDTTDLFSFEIDTPDDYSRAQQLWPKELD